MDKTAQYIQLISIALKVGNDLVEAIKAHAKANLTDAEYASLEQGWIDLEAETARNAGL